MTWLALMHRAHQLPVLTFPGWFLQDGREGPTKGEKWSTDIDAADWMSIQTLPAHAGVYIDEIPQFFDSAVFGTTTSRLFGYVTSQRRKLDLTIGYTAQNWMHVHPRIRFTTHYLLVCRDQYWDPDQRADGRRRGEFINLSCWDVKGFNTGQEWSPMGRITIFAHHLWPYYDTYGIVDPSEGMIQVKMKKQQMVYEATADGPKIYRPGDYSEDAPEPPVDLTGDSMKDAELLSNLANSGGMDMSQLARLRRGLARGRK